MTYLFNNFYKNKTHFAVSFCQWIFDSASDYPRAATPLSGTLIPAGEHPKL
ncbi:Hypothetical protein CPI37_1670 [Corynebacterium pseudotuberculosis]|nr:Hypothetical protein CPI37_1670 [Corynebacterium pseudotuberculosis]